MRRILENGNSQHVVVNPLRRSGCVWHEEAWIESRRFTVGSTEFYLDLGWLFIWNGSSPNWTAPKSTAKAFPAF